MGGHLSTNRAVHNDNRLFITDILQNVLSVKEGKTMQDNKQKENQIAEVPFYIFEAVQEKNLREAWRTNLCWAAVNAVLAVLLYVSRRSGGSRA